MKRFGRLFALIRKELLTIWVDKRSRIILIAPPLCQLFIFTFAATLDVKNVTIGIVNRDHGEKGFELVERFQGSRTFSHVIPLAALQEIAPFIDNQEGIAVLSIDEEFSRKLDAHQKVCVQVILDGRKSNTAQIVAGYINEVIAKFGADHERSLQREKIVLVQRNWFNPNLTYYWFTVPGLLTVLTMVGTLLITGLSVARERELGTFDQLMVSPLRPWEILIGKSIPAVLVGMAEGTVISAVGVFLFKVPFEGSLSLLYLS